MDSSNRGEGWTSDIERARFWRAFTTMWMEKRRAWNSGFRVGVAAGFVTAALVGAAALALAQNR